MLPGATTWIHRQFPDPRSFNGNEELIFTGFRVVRDEIVRWIDRHFEVKRYTNTRQTFVSVNTIEF